jgi:ABC-type taurine transport system ATPase subunit
MMQVNLLNIWAECGITVLFVTHDVDAAVFLGNRVLVVSASRGRIVADFAIDKPRRAIATSPRSSASLNCDDVATSRSVPRASRRSSSTIDAARGIN